MILVYYREYRGSCCAHDDAVYATTTKCNFQVRDLAGNKAHISKLVEKGFVLGDNGPHHILVIQRGAERRVE